jgi:serine/threonine protein kinase
MSDIEDHLDASPGFFIDSYKVVRKLGTGTFGRVFLCQKQQYHAPAQQSLGKKFKKARHFSNNVRMFRDDRAHHSRDDRGQSLRDDRAQRDEEALAEAEATLNSPYVAVKVIRPVPKYIKEAQEEVAIMRALASPFVPKCLEAKAWRDRYIVVTPAYGPNLY